MGDVAFELIKVFGPMGFIMWLMWHTTTRTIPALVENFETSLESQRADFKEINAQQRDDFERMMSRGFGARPAEPTPDRAEQASPDSVG